MISRTTETQTLIADIDRLLSNKRLSRFLSSQASEPRQVLERIRDFLIRLAESDAQAGDMNNQGEQQQSPLIAKFVVQNHQFPSQQQNQLRREPNIVLPTPAEQSFSTLLAPLQAELQTLLQERAVLVQEIRQLEQRRLQNYSLAQQLANQERIISEFLQVLMNRLVPNLKLQGTGNSPNSPGQGQQLQKADETHGFSLSSSQNSTEPVASSSQPLLESPERVEQLTRVARELDQKLLSLDGTVNFVFDALQRNIQTYHESLSQALSRMYSQGLQGEKLLTSLIENLIAQLQKSPVNDSSDEKLFEETVSPNSLLKNQVDDLDLSMGESVSFIQDSLVTNITSKIDIPSLPPTQTHTIESVAEPQDTLRDRSSHELLSSEPEEGPSTDSSGHQDDDIIPNLDAVLLQLNQNQSDDLKENNNNDENTVVEDNPLLIRDEVEQLYASLFNNDDLTVSFSEVSSSAATTENENQNQEISESFTLELIAPDIPSDSPEAIAPDIPSDSPEAIAPDIPSNSPEAIAPDIPSNSPEAIAPDIPSNSPEAIAPDIPSNSPEAIKTEDEITEILDVQQLATPVANQEQSEFIPYEIVFEATETIQELTGDAQLCESQTSNYPTVVPDPWFDEPDAGLLDGGDSIDAEQNLQTPQGQAPEQSLENDQLSEIFVNVTLPSLAPTNGTTEPESTETITALTDLLNELENTEQSPAATSLCTPDALTESEVVASPLTDEAQTASTQTNETDLPQSLEQYIPASPQENLLSQEEVQATAVPNISLEAEQLQRLEQDLENFDKDFDSQSQSLIQNEQPSSQDNILSPQQEQSLTSTELNLNVTEQYQSETEKKKEAPEISASSLPSISHSGGSTEVTRETRNFVWYLGIDLGTTGISAALLNRSTAILYPIYWSAESQSETTSIRRSFRLPAEVYLPVTSSNHEETETKAVQDEQSKSIAVTDEKVSDSLVSDSTRSTSTSTSTQNFFSAQLKPYLHIALPYVRERQKWEPVLQLNDFSTVPLVWIVRSLSKLLLTLKSDRNSTTLGITASAVGLDQQTFHSAINSIAGVVCSCPSHWLEQYRFNIREAFLLSKLVQHPQQVFFVEEAIASLLSELDGANGEVINISSPQGFRLAKTSEHPLVGNTLVINLGASATEMSLVDLPENLEDLTYNDFMLHSFIYGGKGIVQDIICQLLLPPKWRQLRSSISNNSEAITSNPWHWQPDIPGLDQMRLSGLAFEELNLPRPGEPDLTERIRLQQRLESSLLGKALVDAAIAMKLILQHQESFSLDLADQRWILHRRDLESQVFVPFVRRLNRELNRLLVAKGIPTEAINQTVMTGGVASLTAVSRWLRQKLPNTKIIQDLYLGDNGAPTCSRVAYGLAMLPLHPQVLEVPRQQYTDYFLFTELLRLLPDRSLTFGEVIQLLEARGINTRSCQQRLLAFLEGELPSGFIPSTLNSTWLTRSSIENSDYKVISSTPLFEKQGSLSYRPNIEQVRCLHRYLEALKASTQQLLDEPYTVNFVVEAPR